MTLTIFGSVLMQTPGRRRFVNAIFSRGRRSVGQEPRMQRRAGASLPLLATAGVSGGAFLAWRQLYRLHYGEDTVCLRAVYQLGVNRENGFRIMSDPGLLDETTPWWFHIVFRDDKAREIVRELLALIDALLRRGEGAAIREGADVTVGGALQSTHSRDGNISGQVEAHEGQYPQRPLLIRYWVFFGRVLPMPWTSEVFAVDCVDHDKYRLAYRQLVGPYSSFEHSHVVANGGASLDAVPRDPRSSCLIEDTIVASVFGEPVLNWFASLLLKRILWSRGQVLTERYGGEVLSIA
eukprot:TRINITY_DN44659_c0_g1_i1.p1 TRINITY_DN44659_c0_g1~~TRINITY_DN44659_c0_g1_i1.p1  ORF type:complete len:294 (-),score=38.91 TRINITY_DN44659_c0_g1_i1:160-1041(-)